MALRSAPSLDGVVTRLVDVFGICRVRSDWSAVCVLLVVAGGDIRSTSLVRILLRLLGVSGSGGKVSILSLGVVVPNGIVC